MAQAAGGMGRVSVDGGPSRNQFLMQLVANCLDHPLTPCRNAEASALGAAYLAGLATGIWPDLHALSRLCRHDAAIPPAPANFGRHTQIDTWRKAIARTIAAV
jgi:glycerol kinase